MDLFTFTPRPNYQLPDEGVSVAIAPINAIRDCRHTGEGVCVIIA